MPSVARPRRDDNMTHDMTRDMTDARSKRIIRLAAAVAVALCAAACQTVQTTQSGTVGVNRKQTMSSLVPADSFNKSAAEAYRKVLDDAQKKGQLNPDQAQTERVRRIAN